MQWFYDITWRVAPDDPDMVEVERVYCLDYTQFSLPEVARIHALYADLPGWQGWHDQQPYWFGYEVESQVSQGMMSVIATVRLLGAKTFVVGIRPEVVQTIISLGLELSPFCTAATLQEGLRLLDAGLVAGNGSRNQAWC